MATDGQIPSKQDAMIDEIKDIQQEEADMDSISTSGDDW